MISLIKHYYHKLTKKISEPKRSDKWPTVRKHHLEKEGWCKFCGGTEGLQVHHCEPFHIDPAKELDPTNLITLCELMDKECHLHIGHLGNWKNFNPKVREQANSPKVGTPASK
jgi:5-methylcytosine-specific restriction endonuclease McrA